MQTVPTKFESELLRERYYAITHPSGLRIFVFPKQMTAAYAVLATAYGSLDVCFRTPEQSDFTVVPDGVAHYLEHKLFDDPDGTDAFARFSALGADANAYTDYIKTAYLFHTSVNFEQSLAELLRFVTVPYFTEKTVAKERGIIAEEIRMYHDSPSERCLQNVLEGMYWVHPARRNICGSEKSIQKITAELLYECHRTFYQPSNMFLCVCGDVTPEQVTAVVDRILPDKKKPVPILREQVEEPENVMRQEIEVNMDVPKPLFYLATKDSVIPGTAKERLRRDAAMTVLSTALFSGSSDFFNRLYEEGLLTTSYSQGYSGTDSFAFHSICGESDDPYEVRKRFFEYLDEIKRDGIPEEAFLRAKRCLIADQIRAFDSTEEICTNLLAFAMEGLDLFAYPEVLGSVTREECMALLPLFTPSHTCLSVIK